MHIEIVSIGDEILKGMIVNTNAAFISRVLFENGYEVSRHTVFSDEPPILDKELRAALSRSPVIITTGGLGSTLDDHTRKIAAVLFGSEFAYNEKVAQDLKKRYGDKLASLKDQATLPTGAFPLLNAVGTAPGLVFTAPNKMLILLPGIPLEMQRMLLSQVLPLLKERMPVAKKKETALFHLCLVSESTVDPLLRELKERFPDVHMGIYPSYGIVTIMLQSSDAKQLSAVCQALEKRFASHIFLSESGKIEEAVQKWFIQHHKRLALAESCTGGTMASQIVSVAGASEYFLGSFVAYCDALKMRMLGVSEQTLKKRGAVSEECVKEMWEGVCNHTDADFAIAVSGVAGPTGGSAHIPVGTICAALGEKNKKPDIGTFSISGPRPKVIYAATQYLLGALYRKVAHGIPAFPLF